MDEIAAIREKFDFSIPEEFGAMRRAGLIVEDDERNIILSDTQWFSPQEILNYSAPPYRIAGLIPFAYSRRKDYWCWFPTWGTTEAVPVLFAPFGSDAGRGYAPSFLGAIYRMVLEEMSSTWLAELLDLSADEVRARLIQYGNSLSRFLPPPDWALTLCDISSRPIRELEEGVLGILDVQELDAIIHRHLDFDHLNECITIDRT